MQQANALSGEAPKLVHEINENSKKTAGVSYSAASPSGSRHAEGSRPAGSDATSAEDPSAQVSSIPASRMDMWRLSRDALVEAPSDLRLKAKRGDADIDVYP